MIVTVIIPISHMRKLRHKKLRNLPKIAQLVIGTRGIQPQGIMLEPCLLTTVPL